MYFGLSINFKGGMCGDNAYDVERCTGILKLYQKIKVRVPMLDSGIFRPS
jgi:hypothetical protein